MMSISIEAEWERLDSGPPEERACFAAIGLRSGDLWLTEAEDMLVRRVREKVYLSAYKLAEWFAWNWWRLRYEPRRKCLEWALSHNMASIGDGYVWPNITIVSDGEQIVFDAEPTLPRPAESLRYISRIAIAVKANEFVDAVDAFVDQVRGQLNAEGVAGSNLDAIWTEVLAERADPAATVYRRFEALLSRDPDEANEDLVNGLIRDAGQLGNQAMGEVAADHGPNGEVITAATIEEIADESGFDSRPADAIRLDPAVGLSPYGEVAAWTRGAETARALRLQERLGASPISNDRLSAMFGVPTAVIVERARHSTLSFALDRTDALGRVALRSKYVTGRRFDLARLIGDRITVGDDGRLFPATRAYTYRQRLQRSFAAEFLCPFDALEDMLAGDYSMDHLEDAAEQFNVSERTVRTLLVNHGRLERDELGDEFDVATTA